MAIRSARWVVTATAVCIPVFLAKPAGADEALTAHNKAVVRDFYTTVLIDRNIDAAPGLCGRIISSTILKCQAD